MATAFRPAFTRSRPSAGPPGPPRRLDLPDLAVATAGASRGRPPAAEPAFSVDELARAAAAAVTREVEARDRSWREGLESRTARAMTGIADALEAARASHEAVLQALAAEVASLATAAFRALLGPALAEVGALRLTALVADLLRSLPERPALQILCHPLDRDAVDAACRAVAAAGSIAASIDEDPRLDPGRIVARWSDSWAELDTPGLVQRLERAIRDAAVPSGVLRTVTGAAAPIDRSGGDAT